MAPRRILIDNATLGGVERITGRVQTASLDQVDNDILCLERLVTAILFSDELLAIDDYKGRFRTQRLKAFDYVRFLKPDEEVRTSVAEDAAAFARGMMFSFDGAEPAADVAAFFEALRIEPQLRWDIFVSSEYLTLSLLVRDTRHASYEHRIDGVFTGEALDTERSAELPDNTPTVSVVGRPEIEDVKALVRALASGNPNYAGTHANSMLDRLVFGYGWAAERSYFYNALADRESADVCLAPLRDAFCESCCRIDHPGQVDSLIEALKRTTRTSLEAILEPDGRARFAMRLPFFVSYLISKTDNPGQCIDLALSLRSRPEFTGCRTILDNLQHLSPADRTREINSILRYLEQSCADLMRRYEVSTDGGPQYSLSLGVSGIGIGTSAKLSQLFRSYRNRPFSRVFRNIAQDMLNVERMGTLHDRIRSSLREHPKLRWSRISMAPRVLRRRENEHGRPVDF
jgi:hypothetical protein